MNCNEPQTAALLATIAELTHALRLETQLADRNAELAAEYKSALRLADRNAVLAAKYKDALENIQLWINEGLRR